MSAFLITGSAKGIGQACALHFARQGHLVFAGVRNAADGVALRSQAGDRIEPLSLDVTRTDEISRVALTLKTRLGDQGLDGLVNNAGIAVAGPLEFLPLEELRQQLEVNVIGQMAVTQALLPLIRQGRGRIVNVSSIAGRSALPLTGAYAASKHALEAVTDALRVELLPWGIHVVLIEPGIIATPMWQTSIAAAERIMDRLPATAIQYYGQVIDAMKQRAQDNAQRGLSPERVVRAVEHALLARKPRTRYVVGRDARVRLLLEWLPDRWRDRVIARRLARVQAPRA